MTKRSLSLLLAVLFLLTAFPFSALAEDELPPEELPTDEVCNNEEQKETESSEEYDDSYLEEIAHQGAINKDIQIYSQWDVDAYGDGGSNWLNTSGCGWFSLGHMLQWLGIVPKDAENGNAMPCKLYKESGINTVSSFNSAAQWVANKYSTSLSMTGDMDVKSILKDGGVAIINQYGHFYAAVELSADENYVHIIDSCLSVPYQNGVTAYTSAGTQVPLKSCAARTNQPWYCAEGYVMNKASLSWSEIWTYSGGSYWVTVGEVAGHVQCAFYPAFSGKCGYGMTWQFDAKQKRLTIDVSGTTSYNYLAGGCWDGFQQSIQSIYISNGVTNIGSNAFEHCTNLTSIYLPDSLSSIETGAFFECSSLSNITIPKNVSNIGERVFESCLSLKAINVDPANSHYTDIDGVLFSSDKGTLIAYPPGREGAYSIPDGVTMIGARAFYSCQKMTDILFNKGVKSIGKEAFYRCDGLTGLVLSDSIKSIGEEAFACCKNLKTVHISKSMTEIGKSCFYACESLESLFIPVGITNIHEYAFNFCGNLSDVYYLGTEAQKENIDINNRYWQGSLLAANWHHIDDCVINEETFPDKVFRKWVIDELANGKNYMFKSETERVADIFVSCKGIQSVKGIEYFPNLDSLDVSNIGEENEVKNSIYSLDVSHNPKLQSLFCSDNHLASLDLEYNPLLEDYFCYFGNQHIDGQTLMEMNQRYFFDLSTLVTDISKVSIISEKAKYDKETGIVDFDSFVVDFSYLYDTGAGPMDVTISFANVAGSPTINTQPTDVTVNNGATAKFSVKAKNGKSYQWEVSVDGGESWENVAKATKSTLSVKTEKVMAESEQPYQYRCKVSSADGSVYTDAVTLTVNLVPPVITGQPDNSSVYNTKKASFTVKAKNSKSFQWEVSEDGESWETIAGATKASYSLTADYKAMNGRQYRCKVSNADGYVYTDAATLTVNLVPPVITGQPVNVSVRNGKNANLTIKAKGAKKYQWQVNDGSGWVDIPMATKNKLALKKVTFDMNGNQYRCVAINADGEVTSEAATLTVYLVLPTVTAEPKDAAVKAGKTASFTIKAKEGKTYQWQVNDGSGWVDVPKATKNKLSLKKVTGDMSGNRYRCIVTNADGFVESAAARLTVNP